jgi:hypothetical protein
MIVGRGTPVTIAENVRFETTGRPALILRYLFLDHYKEYPKTELGCCGFLSK